ncbi:LUD domain-containing protein [Arcobacter sp. KX21116]|jgi:L-lactate dehydrogenase complex protein LldG|uniref:LutC/YkgG family protein n=1 Tax=Arcobacter iocasae TaxID=2906515 RepID=UPI0035D48144|tara:strand:- start:99 stop:686 length:588 start_codon:yes stop_codon:yes gene_type:complete
MSSRDEILNAIKSNNVVKDEILPEYDHFGITFENKLEKYGQVLKTVGGESLVTTKDKLDDTIKDLYKEGLGQVYSNVEFCSLSNFDANAQDDAHNLKDIDLAIVKGNFAVAENGAVWLKDENNRHRSLYFIAQNIIIVVNKNDIVNNMHEAYTKIEFENSGYGVFVSGPSKTADIEQSLVIGAHGPKSGYVIFVE